MKYAIEWKNGFDVSDEEALHAVSNAGFEGFFLLWKRGIDIDSIKRIADKNDLVFQSIHAPFYNANKLWLPGDEGEDELLDLIACLDDCKKVGAPIMVTHVFIGFEKEHPTDIGIERFSRLLDYAEKVGVMVAFENTEGEGYLAAVKSNFWRRKCSGFCIDTGHEMCYNQGRDMITEYGSGGKLIATHLNDNLGITGEEITWKDDAHLLPFDGIADWVSVARRLRAVGYDGEFLTLELNINSKPDRRTHIVYFGWSYDEFLKNAMNRVKRINEIFVAGD